MPLAAHSKEHDISLTLAESSNRTCLDARDGTASGTGFPVPRRRSSVRTRWARWTALLAFAALGFAIATLMVHVDPTTISPASLLAPSRTSPAGVSMRREAPDSFSNVLYQHPRALARRAR